MRMHLLENVRIRVEAGHIDYVNELRWGQGWWGGGGGLPALCWYNGEGLHLSPAAAACARLSL